MINVKLKDGSSREVREGANIYDLASLISNNFKTKYKWKNFLDFIIKTFKTDV